MSNFLSILIYLLIYSFLKSNNIFLTVFLFLSTVYKSSNNNLKNIYPNARPFKINQIIL